MFFTKKPATTSWTPILFLLAIAIAAVVWSQVLAAVSVNAPAQDVRTLP